MTEERREAARKMFPDGIAASIAGVKVRIVDLSVIGARVEHDERFPLSAPELRIAWGESEAILPVKVARSEIIGRRESRLVYATGIRFTAADEKAHDVVASILNWATPQSTAEERRPDVAEAVPGVEVSPLSEASPGMDAEPRMSPEALAEPAPSNEAAAPPQPSRPKPPPESNDDSWTRKVNFLTSHAAEDDLPYAKFRLIDGRWEKTYAATHDQPEDGFTIPRDEPDSDQLQRTFETADPETRRMMQIALESKLALSTRSA